ncbi:MAG: hypothetical protein ACREQD_13705, partial [Candidatus Binataceae bacterium]
IYNSPTWLWGSIFVAVFTALACGGLYVFHRLIHLEVRKAHNELAGFTIAIISVVYAVLLAFIAIATWEAYSHADDIVETESDLAGDIYLDTQGLPKARGEGIRHDIAQYVSTVIDDEWPTQRAGKTPEQGWKPLLELNSAIVKIQPQNLGEAVIEAELLKTWNELYRARSARLSAVEGHVPAVIWWIIFFGGVVTTGYTYLFGFESFGMHLAMTATVAATLALVVVLIIALDWPFRGEISVKPDAFILTQKSWAGLSLDQQ